MNTSDKKIDYFLWLNGKAAEVQSLPHSIQTLVY
jgi:glucosylceramidase